MTIDMLELSRRAHRSVGGAEVHTRPRYAEQVKSYYTAEDPVTIEAQAPFMPAPDTSK
jgi:hypothetical protein